MDKWIIALKMPESIANEPLRSKENVGADVIPPLPIAAAQLLERHSAALSVFALSLLVFEGHLRLFTEAAS